MGGKGMDNVKKCLSFRFFESLLSYHAFFTLLMADAALILRDKPENMLLLFAMLGAYYVVILTFSLLLGLVDGTRKVRILTGTYIAVFLAIFAIGCIINFKYAVILTALLIGVSFVNDKIRFCQTYRCDDEERKIQSTLSKIFETRTFYILSQIVLVFGTMALLGYFWLFNQNINVFVRLISFGTYCIMVPIFGIFQDNSENAERYEEASREALARYRREARYRNYDD